MSGVTQLESEAAGDAQKARLDDGEVGPGEVDADRRHRAQHKPAVVEIEYVVHSAGDRGRR